MLSALSIITIDTLQLIIEANLTIRLCMRRRFLKQAIKEEYSPARRQSIHRDTSFFHGYCFSCNLFRHKAIDCKSYGNERNMRHKSHMYNNFRSHDSFAPFSSHLRCYIYNKFGHMEKDCRSKLMRSLRQYK